MKVPTGAFVARRNGKVFATGNSGFPKSMDVSKAIDKARDDHPEIRVVCRAIRAAMDAKGLRSRDLVEHFDDCHPRLIDHWAARDTDSQPSLPKWDQWQILRELLDLGPEYDAEVWRLNGRKGTPGEAWDQREVLVARQAKDRRSDGTVIGLGHAGSADITAPATPEAERWAGWGTALKPAIEPVIVARKPIKGTVAVNVLAHGTGGINVDGCRVAATDKAKLPAGVVSETEDVFGDGDGMYAGRPRPADNNPEGRFPPNVLLDPEAAAAMDEQSGVTRSSPSPRRNTAEAHNATASMGKSSGDWVTKGHSDSGGASRFFPVFKYQAKAPAKERPQHTAEDGTVVKHPTVKPLELMRWLVRLVTPPDGIVLDPFSGSGTTAEAAINEGFRCVAIEGSDEYIPLIQQRIDRAETDTEVK